MGCIFAPLITYIRKKARKANKASNKRANNIGKFVNLAPNMFRLHFKFTRRVAGMFKKTVFCLYLSSFMPIKKCPFYLQQCMPNARVFMLAYTQLSLRVELFTRILCIEKKSEWLMPFTLPFCCQVAVHLLVGENPYQN